MEVISHAHVLFNQVPVRSKMSVSGTYTDTQANQFVSFSLGQCSGSKLKRSESDALLSQPPHFF